MFTRIKEKIMQTIARKLKAHLQLLERQEIASVIASLKYAGKSIYVDEGNRFIHPECISIGDQGYYGKNNRIEAVTEDNGIKYSPELVIGNHVSMLDNVHIACAGSVTIGDGCGIASRSYITDHFHGSIKSDDLKYGPPYMRPLSVKPVTIGKNVWIGENVSVMPGVTLGDNVIVGANSVVTHSFGPNSVIAGCPARIIKVLE